MLAAFDYLEWLINILESFEAGARRRRRSLLQHIVNPSKPSGDFPDSIDMRKPLLGHL